LRYKQLSVIVGSGVGEAVCVEGEWKVWITVKVGEKRWNHMGDD